MMTNDQLQIWRESVHCKTEPYSQNFTGLQSIFLTQQDLFWSKLEPFTSSAHKVKSDHHSKFSNLSNWKEEA